MFPASIDSLISQNVLILGDGSRGSGDCGPDARRRQGPGQHPAAAVPKLRHPDFQAEAMGGAMLEGETRAAAAPPPFPPALGGDAPASPTIVVSETLTLGSFGCCCS